MVEMVVVFLGGSCGGRSSGSDSSDISISSNTCNIVAYAYVCV